MMGDILKSNGYKYIKRSRCGKCRFSKYNIYSSEYKCKMFDRKVWGDATCRQFKRIKSKKIVFYKEERK